AELPPLARVHVSRVLIGVVRERGGCFDSAVTLSGAAIGVQPDGQSAYIAMSQAMHREGDGRAAARVLARLFERRLTPSSNDPWWDYPFGNWRNAKSMLDLLRTETR